MYEIYFYDHHGHHQDARNGVVTLSWDQLQARGGDKTLRGPPQAEVLATMAIDDDEDTMAIWHYASSQASPPWHFGNR